jgi:hypothetical protein
MLKKSPHENNSVKYAKTKEGGQIPTACVGFGPLLRDRVRNNYTLPEQYLNMKLNPPSFLVRLYYLNFINKIVIKSQVLFREDNKKGVFMAWGMWSYTMKK